MAGIDDADREPDFDLRIPHDVLSLAERFQGEWYNGGFSQLFGNWYPVDVQLIPDGLKIIGADEAASVVGKAIAEMGMPEQWRDRGHRALLNPSESLAARLNELDREFDKYADGVDKLIASYELKLAKVERDESVDDDVGPAGRKLWLIYEAYLARRVSELSGPERTFFVLWNFHASICTDGLSSFLQQSGGELVPFIRNDLKAAGATYYSPIVDEALALVASPPFDLLERLAALDKKFFDRLDDFVIDIYNYASRHRDSFGQPDDFWQEGIAP